MTIFGSGEYMQDISELLVKEIKKDNLIEINFIKKYVKDYINKNGLNRYFNELVLEVPKHALKCNLICVYDPKTKNLHIDDDRMISSIINATYLKDKEAFDDNDLIFIYALYLVYITHELTHIKQNKIVHSFKNTPEVRLIRDSFIVHDKYYEFYLANHEIFMSEHNANMEAIFEVLDLFCDANLLKDKWILNEYNSFMSNFITKSYEKAGNFLISPTALFYENFKEKDNFYTLEKQISKNNFKRILYGMPFDVDLYNRLKMIENKHAEVSNVKKMILRSGDYGKSF